MRGGGEVFFAHYLLFIWPDIQIVGAEPVPGGQRADHAGHHLHRPGMLTYPIFLIVVRSYQFTKMDYTIKLGNKPKLSIISRNMLSFLSTLEYKSDLFIKSDPDPKSL